MKRLRIGISSCLLGDAVRFDGGHKRDHFLTQVLAPYVEWIRVCPEVEVGMGVPRETLRLVRINGDTRMITTRTGIDHTDSMRAYAVRRTRALASMDLRGYVLKKDSPSCGLDRVKVYGEGGGARSGVGTYAEVLKARFPYLPIEEEGRLNDPILRENFIERVFAYDRLRELFDGRWTQKSLIAFHTAHKMALLAHSTTAYQELGRLVAAGTITPRGELQRQYEECFMRALAKPATTRRHINVLMHMAGHLKSQLDDASKRELLDCIDEYRRELVPLVVPLTLLRHHVRAHGIEYLAGQTYLEPHPRELMLRNHV
ncbi:MAG TPA: DUF523 and DUF1722 domain-containing protein [Vicinamibacterales bacterium]|nr:DUF523 and DUF1722 domain-containing protein [Vicinamibacterales bacterium]